MIAFWQPKVNSYKTISSYVKSGQIYLAPKKP